MPERMRLLRSIAEITADYREGEVAPPTPEHVARWIEQFPQDVHEPILREMEHVLHRQYLSRTRVEKFLSGVITNAKLTDGNPAKFWSGVNFLDIQGAGHSQSSLLEIFDRSLRSACGLPIAGCGQNPHSYLYLDDVLFSGGRIKSDLGEWVQNSAPAKANVIVLAIMFHTQGLYFAKKDLQKIIGDSGKAIDVKWRRAAIVDDGIARVNTSDVLRLTSVPDEPQAMAYVEGLGKPLELRTGSGSKLFSSETGRTLLEQEFFKAGLRIRELCPALDIYMRPLGRTLLKTPGFGSMVVTWRNCPNNAPLALWAGHPWYPLFARKTN
ncbi:MAG: hypothetical protein RL367_715 [Pseudomonadota bacterium]